MSQRPTCKAQKIYNKKEKKKISFWTPELYKHEEKRQRSTAVKSGGAVPAGSKERQGNLSIEGQERRGQVGDDDQVTGEVGVLQEAPRKGLRVEGKGAMNMGRAYTKFVCEVEILITGDGRVKLLFVSGDGKPGRASQQLNGENWGFRALGWGPGGRSAPQPKPAETTVKRETPFELKMAFRVHLLVFPRISGLFLAISSVSTTSLKAHILKKARIS